MQQYGKYDYLCGEMCAKHSHHHHTSTEGLSKLGSLLALGCAIHCMATPFVMLLIPTFFGKLFQNEWMEIGITASCFLLTSFPIFKNLKIHKNFLPLILLGTGFLSFLGSQMVEHFNHNLHTILSVFVGLFIFSAVYIDRKKTHQVVYHLPQE